MYTFIFKKKTKICLQCWLKRRMFVKLHLLTPLPYGLAPMKHKTNLLVLHQGIVGIEVGQSRFGYSMAGKQKR